MLHVLQVPIGWDQIYTLSVPALRRGGVWGPCAHVRALRSVVADRAVPQSLATSSTYALAAVEPVAKMDEPPVREQLRESDVYVRRAANEGGAHTLPIHSLEHVKVHQLGVGKRRCQVSLVVRNATILPNDRGAINDHVHVHVLILTLYTIQYKRPSKFNY